MAQCLVSDWGQWPLPLTLITLIPAGIINCIHYNVWDEITYPLQNFNSGTVEVWEWISNFTPHFTGHEISLTSTWWSSYGKFIVSIMEKIDHVIPRLNYILQSGYPFWLYIIHCQCNSHCLYPTYDSYPPCWRWHVSDLLELTCELCHSGWSMLNGMFNSGGLYMVPSHYSNFPIIFITDNAKITLCESTKNIISKITVLKWDHNAYDCYSWYFHDGYHDMKTPSVLLAHCYGNPPVIPSWRMSNTMLSLLLTRTNNEVLGDLRHHVSHMTSLWWPHFLSRLTLYFVTFSAAYVHLVDIYISMYQPDKQMNSIKYETEVSTVGFIRVHELNKARSVKRLKYCLYQRHLLNMW